MPNWCCGTLKVRGEKSNLEQFVSEGLVPVGFGGEKKPPLEKDEYGDIHSKETCWIVGTHRGFVDRVSIYFSEIEYGGIITFDAKFAWGISAEELQKICQKYHIDMKIYAFEKGMQVNQDIEIVDGEITTDKEIKFSDYSWECIEPELGG